MLLVLHGAKLNAGDFLIRERGLEILRHLRPVQRLVIHPRWEPVDPDLFDSADAVVLCGGPGLARRFYPRVFAMVDDLDAHPTPVLPVALGWSGTPADIPERFKFSPKSLAALRAIHARIGWSGVRDELSLEIVRRADVGEVRRTGCFAWYHLPSMGQPCTPQSVSVAWRSRPHRGAGQEACARSLPCSAASAGAIHERSATASSSAGFGRSSRPRPRPGSAWPLRRLLGGSATGWSMRVATSAPSSCTARSTYTSATASTPTSARSAGAARAC